MLLTILKLLVCSALKYREVHVEVLDSHVHVTNSLLIFLTLHIQLFADLLEKVDFSLIVGDTVSVSGNSRSISTCNPKING